MERYYVCFSYLQIIKRFIDFLFFLVYAILLLQMRNRMQIYIYCTKIETLVVIKFI